MYFMHGCLPRSGFRFRHVKYIFHTISIIYSVNCIYAFNELYCFFQWCFSPTFLTLSQPTHIYSADIQEGRTRMFSYWQWRRYIRDETAWGWEYLQICNEDSGHDMGLRMNFTVKKSRPIGSMGRRMRKFPYFLNLCNEQSIRRWNWGWKIFIFL